MEAARAKIEAALRARDDPTAVPKLVYAPFYEIPPAAAAAAKPPPPKLPTFHALPDIPESREEREQLPWKRPTQPKKTQLPLKKPPPPLPQGLDPCHHAGSSSDHGCRPPPLPQGLDPGDDIVIPPKNVAGPVSPKKSKKAPPSLQNLPTPKEQIPLKKPPPAVGNPMLACKGPPPTFCFRGAVAISDTTPNWKTACQPDMTDPKPSSASL